MTPARARWPRPPRRSRSGSAPTARRAARDIAPAGRVIAVFQPHLFSRTRIFAAQFGAALGLADEVFVLDVYPAREDPEPGVTGELVASAVPGGQAVFLPDRAAAPGGVADVARPGDLVLTMGAGDVTALGPLIVAALGARAGARRRRGPGRAAAHPPQHRRGGAAGRRDPAGAVRAGQQELAVHGRDLGPAPDPGLRGRGARRVRAGGRLRG